MIGLISDAVQIIKAHTIADALGVERFFVGESDFTGLKYSICLSEFFYFFESLNKFAFDVITVLLHFIEKFIGNEAGLAVFFSQQHQSINELALSCCGVEAGFGVLEEILIDPDFPLRVIADCNHLLCGSEHSEDIDECVIAYHHFFEEIDDLREGQHINIG